MNHTIRYLTRADVETLSISMDEVIQRKEDAFREKGAGASHMPPKHWIAPDEHRFFSAMSGALPGFGAAACKWQSGSDQNHEHGLPYITGLLILNELDSGLPVAIMDSTWITAMRTAAATGVTSRYLASRGPRTVGIIGCGVQGRTNLAALMRVHDTIRSVNVYDIERDAADHFIREMEELHGLEVKRLDYPHDVIARGDIVVTGGPIVPGGDRCIAADWLQPGSLLVTLDYDCYLADGVLHEVEAVFTDDLGQLQHLAEFGFFCNAPDHIAEIGSVIVGANAGRSQQSDRIIAVNMGIALEDVAIATLVHERAMQRDAGCLLSL